MTDAATRIDTSPEPPSRMLGKWMSAAMVVGTMVGSGIYLLPTTLAPYGPNLVFAFVLTGLGTMCLAFAMARMAARIPGGPFAYIDRAFGERTAFITLWCYTISQVTGVAGVCVAVAGALGHVDPALATGPGLIATALVAIAVLTLVNLRGARSAGVLQVVTTLIKLAPLLLVMALALGHFATARPLEPLAPAPLTIGGIAAAAALILFSLTGFEAAVMTANVTRDSTTTVPRTTIGGTGFTAIIYLLATVATLMLLSSATAAGSTAPVADAMVPAFGAAAGLLVAMIAAVSAFGTGNALLLIAAESARTMAQARDLPAIFARSNKVGAPAGSLLICGAAAALLVLASSSKNFVSVYVLITLVSTLLSLVLYVVCASAALKLKVAGKAAIIVAIGVLYSIAMFFGAGGEAVLWSLLLGVAGLPIRWLSRRFSSAAATPPEAAPAAPRE
jgi:APA family basic amino acid/polyamine antiporter